MYTKNFDAGRLKTDCFTIFVVKTGRPSALLSPCKAWLTVVLVGLKADEIACVLYIPNFPAGCACIKTTNVCPTYNRRNQQSYILVQRIAVSCSWYHTPIQIMSCIRNSLSFCYNLLSPFLISFVWGLVCCQITSLAYRYWNCTKDRFAESIWCTYYVFSKYWLISP